MSERKQDWIITVKLTETVPAPSPTQHYDHSMSRQEVEHQIETQLRRIDGMKVRQVMVAADGPRYY